MLEKELDKPYESPSKYRTPGDINSEIFPNVSGPKFLLYLGIELACVGACVVMDKTKELYHKITIRK